MQATYSKLAAPPGVCTMGQCVIEMEYSGRLRLSPSSSCRRDFHDGLFGVDISALTTLQSIMETVTCRPDIRNLKIYDTIARRRVTKTKQIFTEDNNSE